MNICIEHNNNINYIQNIKNKIIEPSLCEKNKTNFKDFTRNRKLPFDRMIGLLLNKPEHSITSRLNLGYEKLFPNDLDVIPTSSAFIQARKKINHQVFVDLLNYSNTLFYQNLENKYKVNTWKRHTLLAIDGSRFTIPATEKTEPLFSRIRSKNQKEGVLQGNAVFLYDFLNNLPLNVSFGKVEAEKSLSLKSIFLSLKMDL
ncbi:hypothetical protein [Candidatus Harpocratesius sp.]